MADIYGEDMDVLPEDSAADEGGKKKKKDRKQSRFADVFDCLETFCYALVLMMILFVFVLRFVTVNGTSMVETLQHNDKLIISDVLYTPSTGDIVVIDADGLFQDRYIIKRVIATGGQTVDLNFENWEVRVDGTLLEEDYVHYDGTPMKTEMWIETSESVVKTYEDGMLKKASFTVPEGQIFVMGDNRNGSSDGRQVGCLDEDRVLGRVLIRVGPKSSFGRVE